MGYLQEDMETREERRERARKRMLRAQAEKIRRIKIYSCIIAVGVIGIMLAAWRVFGGGSSCASCVGACRFCSGDDRLRDIINSDDKNDGAHSVNGTVSNESDDKKPTVNIVEPEETTELENYEYGDDLYVDGEFVVCIDAGHGGSDTGCESKDGTYEKDDDLKLATALRYKLEAMGVTVIMTRTADVRISLEERVYIANSSNADVFISIHRNAADVSSAKGFEAWVNSKDSDNAYELASHIMDSIEKVGISNNRGVKKGTMEDNGDDYKINYLSCMPSMLLEMGFMSSPTDNRLFKENLADYATSIAESIVQWSKSRSY